MSQAARTSSWICALVVVAITSSYLTWLSVPKNHRGYNISGSFLDKLLREHPNVSRKAHGIFKVDYGSLTEEFNASPNEQDRLTWAEEFENRNLILDSSKKWIIVKESGVYLVYLQVTYSLRLVNDSIPLDLLVDFSWNDGKQEFAAVFDTQKHTNKNQALLSTFLLLHMKTNNSLAVRARPKDMIRYNDTRPITSYITIVRYADL